MKIFASSLLIGLIAVAMLCFISPRIQAQENDEAESVSDLEKPPELSSELERSPELSSEPEQPPELDADLEAPPPLPPKIQDEQIEPTVTIRKEEDRTIEEYSYNGTIYMVKVTPENGEPYFFVDLDGDGNLERDERSKTFQPVEPAQWKIKEWD